MHVAGQFTLTHLPITLYYTTKWSVTDKFLHRIQYFYFPNVLLFPLIDYGKFWGMFLQYIFERLSWLGMLSVEQQIQRQYEFIEKIGTGSFGHIISVRSRSTHQPYAVKIEKSHGKKTVLVEKEFAILAELAPLPHFPRVYAFKKLKENSFIVMEKLDRNLEEVFLERGRKFSLGTVAMVAGQMVAALRDLHEAGYLHRDLKPENMMLHTGQHCVKLIDFGLADHLKVRRASTLIGNVRFCSRGSHFGLSSKKDDLQSLIYVLFYFASGSLPWQNSSKQDIQAQINRRTDLALPSQPDTPILTSKGQFLSLANFPPSKNEIKNAFFGQFMRLAEYVYNLPSKEEPDYRWMVHQCERLMLLAGTRSGRCFDWCGADCGMRKEEELWTIFQ